MFAGLSHLQQGTLHVVLTEDHDTAVSLSPAAQSRLPQATAVVAPQAQAQDLVDEVNAGAANRKAITAAVIAQLAATDSALASTGTIWSYRLVLQCATIVINMQHNLQTLEFAYSSQHKVDSLTLKCC